jgi:DNA-binding beta-propeller fold protein YncE
MRSTSDESRAHTRWGPALALLALGLAAGQRPAHAQTLYWIDTVYGTPTLNRSDIAGGGHTSIALTPGKLPEGLVFDPASNRLFWMESSFTSARLMKAFENLNTPSPLLIGASCGRGLAIDPVAHDLYWTTSNLTVGSDLRMVGTDGSSQNVLSSFGSTANPRGIALDDAGATAYWADFDGGVINRTTLAGGATAPIQTLSPGSGPYGVAHAPSSTLIYWTEYNTGRLCRASTSGGSVTVLATGLHNPTYLALDNENNRVYWIEAAAGGQKIRCLSIPNAAISDLPLAVSSFGGIAIKPGVFVGVESDVARPSEFALESVAPNPMMSATTISFALPRDATTRVSVMDVSGRVVATLQNGPASAGRHAITWDGTGVDGRHVAAGLYFVRVTSGDRHLTGRLVVVGR